MKKIFIMIICSLLMTGCFYNPRKLPKEILINKKINKLEVYSKVKISDFIKTNASIIDNVYLDTKSIGKKKVEINILYNKRKYIKDISYEVIDSTLPIFLSKPTYRVIDLEFNGNLCDLVNRADNYSKKVDCTHTPIDTKRLGKNDLLYTISDSSGNTDSFKGVVEVVQKLKSSSSINNNTKTVNFKDIYRRYKNKDTLIGLDISKWQGDNLDFNKLKNVGVSFVFIRLGVQVGDDKDLTIDRYFISNYKKARDAGIKIGVYVYTKASKKNILLNQIEWIKENLKKYPVDLGVAYDFEEFNDFQKYKISIHDLNMLYEMFSNSFKKDKITTYLYGSKNNLNNLFYEYNNTWLAHYTSNYNLSDYGRKYKMWQITDKGRIDGFNAYFDIDIYYKKKD